MTEILLVDDERSIRDSLSCQLREAGFEIRVADTGANVSAIRQNTTSDSKAYFKYL